MFSLRMYEKLKKNSYTWFQSDFCEVHTRYGTEITGAY